MQRATVGLRIDGDGSDSELAEGAEDADRDLTAVGDQDFREHAHSRLFSPPTAPARRVPRGVTLLAPRGRADGRLVFAVEILGDPFGPPAARISRRKRLRVEETLDRQRECFAPLGIGLGSRDELHRWSLKALATPDDTNSG